MEVLYFYTNKFISFVYSNTLIKDPVKWGSFHKILTFTLEVPSKDNLIEIGTLNGTIFIHKKDVLTGNTLFYYITQEQYFPASYKKILIDGDITYIIYTYKSFDIFFTKILKLDRKGNLLWQKAIQDFNTIYASLTTEHIIIFTVDKDKVTFVSYNKLGTIRESYELFINDSLPPNKIKNVNKFVITNTESIYIIDDTASIKNIIEFKKPISFTPKGISRYLIIPTNNQCIIYNYKEKKISKTFDLENKLIDIIIQNENRIFLIDSQNIVYEITNLEEIEKIFIPSSEEIIQNIFEIQSIKIIHTNLKIILQNQQKENQILNIQPNTILAFEQTGKLYLINQYTYIQELQELIPF